MAESMMMMAMTSPSQLMTKSRNGCRECKRKRMKCDESRPKCKNCAHRKAECPRYTQKLKWSTKYEVFKPGKQPKERGKRASSPLREQLQLVVQSIGNTNQAAESPIIQGRHVHGDHDLSSAQARNDGNNIVPKSEHLVDTTRMINEPVVPNEGNIVEEDALKDDHSDQDNRPNVAPESSPASPTHETQPDIDFPATTESVQLSPTDGDEEDLPPHAPAPSQSLLRAPSWNASFILWPSAPDLVNLSDQSVQKLMHHYFSTTCRVMSCFDSLTNPYRTAIPQALHNSSHIFPCMMGMAAAHMANFSKDMTTLAIAYQSEAMRSLGEEMGRVVARRGKADVRASSTTYEILLGTIILGMTSAWHDPTANGLSHLLGARLLFNTWSLEQNLYLPNGSVALLTKDQSFIIGSMAYWECLASFITDQPLDATAYLKPFCTPNDEQIIYPHPWTGVATPIFILTAQVGVLMRQKRILEKLANVRKGSAAKVELDGDLLEDAQEIHEQILNYNLPSEDLMEETGDPNTPIAHLCSIAEIYRLTALLELCCAFPTLTTSSPPSEEVEEGKEEHTADTDILAPSILSLVAAVPRESGVFTVLCIPLISAGSAVQSPEWREITRQQILHTSRQIGLAAFHRVAKLVQEAWTRADLRMAMEGKDMMHWMDVMIEMRLETLFG